LKKTKRSLEKSRKPKIDETTFVFAFFPQFLNPTAEQDSSSSRRRDENGLWNPFEAHERRKAEQGNQYGRHINQSASAENDRRAGDGADRRRSNALHKGLDLPVLREPAVVGCNEND